MTGKNIVVSFDDMGMICSNIGYKEFYEYALHFKDIFKDEYDIIKKDLDKLEQLENENQELRLFANKLNNTNFVLCGELADAEKYKQALEKACEKLSDDCPVSQELIEDLNCENCKDNYKECWKKYFLKEVFEV